MIQVGLIDDEPEVESSQEERDESQKRNDRLMIDKPTDNLS